MTAHRTSLLVGQFSHVLHALAPELLAPGLLDIVLTHGDFEHDVNLLLLHEPTTSVVPSHVNSLSGRCFWHTQQ